jgi:hypothetical protein
MTATKLLKTAGSSELRLPVHWFGADRTYGHGLSSGMLIRAAPVFAVFVLCASRLLWIVRTYAVNVFIGDQWFYHEPTLFHRQSVWTIFFWQSSPWRQGLGGLLSLWVGSLSHWNSRYESWIAACLIIAGCLLALCLKVKITGDLSAWDFLIPLFVLSPVEYQTVVGVTHYSHGPLPFLLVILFCFAWTIRLYFLKYPLIVTIGFLCTYTGYGVFIGILCPAVIALDLWTRWSETSKKERKTGIISLVFSFLTLSTFFYGFRFSDGVCPAHAFVNPATGLVVSYPNLLHHFLFVAFMFGNYVGLKATIILVPAVLGGSAILLFVIIELAISLRRRPLQIVPFVLIAYSVLFAVTTAQGRMCLGLSAALGSRYMIYLVPAFLGIYLLAISNRARMAHFIVLSILASVALSGSFSIHRSDQDDMAEIQRLRLGWSECYLFEHNLLDCNHKTGATIYSYPNTIQSQLDFLQRNHLNLFFEPAVQRR